MIASALHEAGCNRAAAARRLGIHRQLLYAKARRYGLSEDRTEDVSDSSPSPLAGEGRSGGTASE
jgi:transposase-like protein